MLRYVAVITIKFFTGKIYIVVILHEIPNFDYYFVLGSSSDYKNPSLNKIKSMLGVGEEVLI